jgi:hypothetical protein
MTKISRTVAEQMARDIVKHALKDEALPLLRRERALFKKLYDKHHPPELRAKMAELQAMMGDEQHTFVEGCVRIPVRSASGYYSQLCIDPGISGARNLWRLAIEECPLALRSFDYNTQYLDGDMSQEFESLCTDKVAFDRKVSTDMNKAIAAVQAFGTYKKLQAGWPEVLPLVQEYIPVAGQSTALAVCVSDLNIVFKLPPNQTEAA